MRRYKPTTAMLVLALSGAFAGHANADCYWKAYDSPKGNTLYLYFPDGPDPDLNFPEFGLRSGNPLLRTRPLQTFDVDDLDLVPGSGSTDRLRQAVFDIVVDDYCEFNVNVVQATDSPATSAAPCPEERCQVVGIGTDSGKTVLGRQHGLADLSQESDVDDHEPRNVARVWGTTVLDSADPGQFQGLSSTLARWARAIGHVASHEAGHNYGLQHDDAEILSSTEDKLDHHILADGEGLTIQDRAENERHFSDQSYQILGHNIGLNINTVHNWDFTNINEKEAHSMTVVLLSEAEDLTMSWHYTGPKGPWNDPTIVLMDEGKVSFQGDDYNAFEVQLTKPKSWNGDTPGVVPAGQVFHIGVAFEESDATIVHGTTLYDSDGNALPFHPRMVGYKVGPPDPPTGDVPVELNVPPPDPGPIGGPAPGPGPGPASDQLELLDLRVSLLPRLADIDTMVDGVQLTDIRRLLVEQRPLQGGRRPPQNLTLGSEPVKLIIANMNDPRHVDITYDATDCEPGFVPSDAEGGEIEYCPTGTSLSLFPSTYIYITATVVDPKARHFDVATGRVVTGPVVSKLFYQVAGIVPDLNQNGVDDLLDIRSSTSTDENKNGVPDEAEPSPPCPWWCLIAIAVVFVVLIFVVRILWRGRKQS